MNWKGVIPAITTCFNQDLSVNHGFIAEHCHWLLENGCAGIVALGSLGEGATFVLDSDPRDGSVERVCLPHPEILSALKPGHKLLLDDGKVRLWDPNSGQLRALLGVVGATGAVRFSPDGHFLAVGGEDGAVIVPLNPPAQKLRMPGS